MNDYSNNLKPHEIFDVLIIGSGPAASLYASRCAEAGRSVLILEAGPERRLEQLYSSQIWARMLKWGGTSVEEHGNHKIGHAFNSGWGSGGGGLHHYAVYPRLHPSDFSVYTDHGHGLDWPINYRQLQPSYDRVQAEIGLSGDTKQEYWRPPGSDYPMPPLPIFAQSRIIAEGFKKNGMSTAPIPLAINSQPYKGRPSCQYDGWCDAGCPIGALANPLVTYLASAIQAGAQLRCESVVTTLHNNRATKKIEGVSYRDQQGKSHKVLAEKVVLAAGTVENSRLLLANHIISPSGNLGRYLMSHPARSIYALFDQPTEPSLGVSGGQLMSHDRYHPKRQSPTSYGSYQWLIGNALKPNDLLGIANTRPDISGSALDPFMRDSAKHMGNMVFVAEDIARRENRVELTQTTDSFGVPIARAIHNLTEQTQSLVDSATKEGLQIMNAAQARESWHGPLIGMHIMGGTAMGNDPNKAVTDQYGRFYGLDNLWIGGASLFPSSGAVNPTFSLLALADRGSESLLN